MARPLTAAFLVLLMFVCGCFQLGLSQNEAYIHRYISWDDINVNDDVHGARLSSRVDSKRNRVVIVDKNGVGDSLTVQGAMNHVPEGNIERVKIYIRPGIYREKVLVPKSKPYISFIGNRSHVFDTLITWNRKASDLDSNGTELGTQRSAAVTVESEYFCSTGLTFQNTVVAVPGGYGMQAIALRVSGDKAFFYRVRILGTQDTLSDADGKHYFYQCHIQGSVDFVFGGPKSLFQECALQSTPKTSGAIAAHGRDSPDKNTGFSFMGCIIKGTGKVLLGRAWGNYSRVVYSYCNIADIIEPSGWSDWNYPDRQRTVAFGKLKPWIKSFNLKEVKEYLGTSFISGNRWLKLS